MSNLTPIIRTDRKNVKLKVWMSSWALIGLGEQGREWSLEEQLRRIAEAGYDGINGPLPGPEDEQEWMELLERYQLSLGINAFPKCTADMVQLFEKVKAYKGHIPFINAQVMTPFLTGSGAEQFLREIDELAKQAGIPVHVETHRGTITQDLLRTVEYVNNLDFLQLTIDFSHYVVAGELHTVSEQAESLLQTLLTRTAGIHGRVSNGEQVQVSVGDNGEHVMVPHFLRWWKSGMNHWLANAQDGDEFTFLCELGPAPYAITKDEYAGRTEEISDRWTQSLWFAKTARALWDECLGER